MRLVSAAARWALALSFLLVPHAANAMALHLGDINGDDLINVSDINCYILATLSNAQGEPDPACQAFPDADADLQCDAALNVLDVQQEIIIRLYKLSGDPGTQALLLVHDPDSDGLHNGCDDDDDNDTYPDVCEDLNGTDPLDPASVPTAVNACTCPNQCDIAGACVGDGEAKADDPCLGCDLGADPVGWTFFDGASCDDGDLCTEADTCNAGACAGTDKTCPDDGDICTVDVCAPLTGSCGLPYTDGAACDDGDLCTVGDACQTGVCVPTGPAVCGDDGDACTEDICDPLTGGCGVLRPLGFPCDDGDACTTVDTCDAGACVGSVPVQCASDGDPCTNAACDSATGACQQLQLTGNVCDDLNPCTTTDVCDAGICVGSGLVTCTDDGNVCTTDICNPKSGGCGVPVIDGTDCDDGDACTAYDECGAGTCGGAAGVELCANGIDDDCDSETDEEPCDVVKPGLADAPVGFTTTLGVASGVVTEIGEGKYASAIVALSEPNHSGSVSGTALGIGAGSAPVSVSAATVGSVALAISSHTVRQDDATTGAYVVVRDQAGRPAPSGTSVLFSVTGPGYTGSFSCSTGANGRCSASLALPPATVSGGGDFSVTAKAGAVTTAPEVVHAEASPAPMVLLAYEAGASLPLGPRFAGTSFTVPFTINSGGQTIGSYDIELSFDPTVLTVTGVTKGAATGFGLPVHNAGGDANTTGLLKFNGINEDPGQPSGSGPAVHVATVTFQVKPGATAWGTGTLSGTLVNLFSSNLTPLSSGEPLVLRDGDGPGPEGLVQVRGIELGGIIAWADTFQLVGLAGMTGATSTASIHVSGIRSNATEASLGADPGTSCTSANPAMVSVGAACLAFAGDKGGNTAVEVEHAGFAATVPFRVATLALPVDLALHDPTLQPITGLGGYQSTTPRALATFSGGGTTFSVDITSLLTWEVQGTAATVNPATGKVTAVAPGSATIVARLADGTEAGSTPVVVASTPAVTLADLLVLMPGEVEELPNAVVNPVPASDGVTYGRLRIAAFLDAELETVQAHVFAVFSDDVETNGGSRVDLTGDGDLGFLSGDEGVVTVDPFGVVTAIGSGETAITATLSDGAGGTLVSGDGTIKVVLPPASDATAAPSAFSLALSASDTAATHLGLPVAKQLAVTMHYKDGTSKDFTNDARTQYDADSLDPNDLVTVTPAGLVESTGNGIGSASVVVTFDTFPSEITTTVTVQVVSHQGLGLASYEIYTPSGARTEEHLLSLIEGSTTFQQAKLELIETFTNGATVNVTTHPDTSYTVTDPVGGAPVAGVVSVSGSAVVSAVAAGSVEITGVANGHASNAVAMGVEQAPVDITQIFPTVASGATFSGVKDSGTTQMSAYGLFADGTHRQLTGANLIPSLLTFASSATQFATINTSGYATIHGNGPTTLSVDIAAGLDALAPYGAPVPINVACNLLPTAGDVDLGDSSGLAHKDRGANESFEMPVRIHTGGKSLGAFDMEIYYDPAVVIATGVTKGSGLGAGATFSGNADTNPGTVFLNGFVSPTAPAVSGAGVEVARIQLTALKSAGGPAITAIDGTVKQVVAADGTTLIGPATPRALIAGAGDLDPACLNDPVLGDANDDCALAASDGLFIQQQLAGLVTPSATQLSKSDAFPDGTVNVNDAYFVSRVLARLAHFVDATATPLGGGAYAIVATVTDRDQSLQDTQVGVRFEVRSVANAATLAFSNPHTATLDGLIVQADPIGGGQYGVEAYGLSNPEVGAGVVVILDILDVNGQPVTSVSYLGSRVTDPAAGFFDPLVTFDVPQADCITLDCDDSNPCTTDSCTAEVGCMNDPLNGVGCDDGDACTSGDACVAGVCEGTLLSCSDDGDPCTLDVCDPATGVCGILSADGTPCDDGEPCTTGDQCVSGACGGQTYPGCEDPGYGLMCIVSGTAGTKVECPIQLVRSSQAELPAAAMQFTIKYSGAMTFDYFSDGVHPVFGVPWLIPANFNGLQSGHTVSMNPKLPADWVVSGSVLLSNTSDPTAPLTDAYLDGGNVIGDPILMTAHFTLAENIPAGTPAEVTLLNIVASDKASGTLQVITTYMTMQTSP